MALSDSDLHRLRKYMAAHGNPHDAQSASYFFDPSRNSGKLPESHSSAGQLEVEGRGREAGEVPRLEAIRAARRLEVLAAQTAYWPARDARRDANLRQAAAALGLDECGARTLVAPFGR